MSLNLPAGAGKNLTYKTLALGADGEPAAIASEQLIASASCNLNTATKQTLFTVPTGKSLIVTRIALRGASISLTTASFGFGFDASATDVDGQSTHTELTGSTLQSQIIVLSGAKIGAAASLFGLKCSILQGAAATLTVDVFGYLV